ncbi:MAG: hypothetical protein WC565_08175 [Parcubacteria group bacterium]|jgi:hypothetical protein
MSRFENLTVGTLLVEDLSAKVLKTGGDPQNGTASVGLNVGSSAAVKGSGVALSSSRTFAAGIFADDNGASIADSVANIRARTLLTYDQAGGSIRSVMGQLKLLTGIDVTTGIYTGVQGYVELAATHSAKTGSTLSAVDASVEIGTALTVDSGGEMAGVHVETTGAGTITNSGTCAGVLVDKASGAASWPDGILIDGASVIMGMRIGKFAGSAATTSAVAFGTSQNIYSDGQLSTMEVHGSSASNLTSAYAAKCGRFRHVCNIGSSGALAHETYGVMGQLVVKEATLQHLHAGVIGTFEGHTSGVVINGTYAYGAAAVMARVGGGAAITATKPVCGMVSFWNGAALASGTSIGFGNAHLTTAWTYGFANAAGSALADIKLQGEDANGLPCCIFSGVATDDTSIVAQVGADTLWADGSVYFAAVDGAGKIWQKRNDIWVDINA